MRTAMPLFRLSWTYSTYAERLLKSDRALKPFPPFFLVGVAVGAESGEPAAGDTDEVQNLGWKMERRMGWGTSSTSSSPPATPPPGCRPEQSGGFRFRSQPMTRTSSEIRLAIAMVKSNSF